MRSYIFAEQSFKLTLIKELVFEFPVGKKLTLPPGVQVYAPPVEWQVGRIGRELFALT